MRLWLTRTAPEADASAGRLRAQGHEVLVAPALQVVALGGGPLDISDAGAVAFTSSNGVRAFAARTAARALPAFAVGRATAQAALDAGFAQVTSAEGGVAELAALILAGPPPRGAVLHAAPRDPAGDLVGRLAAAGVPARSLVLYATEPGPTPAEVLEALSARPPALDAVLVYSARAAQELAASPELAAAAPSLELIAISAAAAAPLRRLNFRRVAVAALPNEPALLTLTATRRD